MYALIDNMPKFVMEGVLSYDNQLYFNALYFPAQAILLTVGSIYKPLLVRMAQMWADAEKRRRFDLVILAIVAVVIVITLAVIFVMATIGIPVMSFMYGVDFEQFRGLSYIMIAAGGVTAIIDFIYQVITVLRRQKSVMKLYVITFGFSLFVPILLIDFTGLPGAVIGYLIVMTILLVLLVWEYASGNCIVIPSGLRKLWQVKRQQRVLMKKALLVLGLVARERRVTKERKLRELPMQGEYLKCLVRMSFPQGMVLIRSMRGELLMKAACKAKSVFQAKNECQVKRDYVLVRNAKSERLVKKRVFEGCAGPTMGCEEVLIAPAKQRINI